MNVVRIKYLFNDVVSEVDVFLYTGVKCSLKINLPGKGEVCIENDDFFECFRNLREMDKSIKYYCKGAKVNVIPSRMSRQMSRGMSAYETKLGEQARKDSLVNIFDYEADGLAVDPAQQDEYREKWYASLTG